MQQRTSLITVGMIVALVGCIAPAQAQEAKHEPLMGTITLRSGATHEGDLRLVAFGVTEAARFGSDPREVDEGGKIEVGVGGETKTIAGRDIASVAVEWEDAGTADKPDWRIVSLTVATRGGETITGKPAWFMSMSQFIIDPAGGADRISVENYPLFPTEFDPGNLIVKVDLTGEAPEAPETPPTPPPSVMPEVPPIPTPVVETPSEETPTEVAPGEETPPEETPAPELVPVAVPSPVATPPVEAAGEPTAASVTLTIKCPHCGEEITITIPALAK